MAVFTGDNASIELAETGQTLVALEHMISYTWNYTANTIENNEFRQKRSSASGNSPVNVTGKATEIVPGRTNWTVDFAFNDDDTTTQRASHPAFNVNTFQGKYVTIRLYEDDTQTGDVYYEGQGLLATISKTNEAGDSLNNGTGQIRGHGDFTMGTV